MLLSFASSHRCILCRRFKAFTMPFPFRFGCWLVFCSFFSVTICHRNNIFINDLIADGARMLVCLPSIFSLFTLEWFAVSTDLFQRYANFIDGPRSEAINLNISYLIIYMHILNCSGNFSFVNAAAYIAPPWKQWRQSSTKQKKTHTHSL